MRDEMALAQVAGLPQFLRYRIPVLAHSRLLGAVVPRTELQVVLQRPGGQVMSQLYRQPYINGHPATLSPDNGKPRRSGGRECEHFDGADDTAYGEDRDAQAPEGGA